MPLLAVVAILAPARGEGGDPTSRLDQRSASRSAAIVAADRRRPLDPQPGVPHPRRRQGARGDDRGGAAGGARRGAARSRSSGLSMAMGAFLAGVLLSTSTFRHQLEADVEPFRGILLGLFFLAVGMSLDLAVVAANWQIIALSVVGYMVGQGRARSTSSRGCSSPSIARGAGARGADGAGRRVRLRALHHRGGVRAHRRPSQRDLHRDGDHLDGADAVRRHGAALLLPKPAAIDGGRRGRRTGCTATCWSSASAASARSPASRCSPRATRISIIDNDTEMIRVAGAVRLQGLLRRRHAARHPARRRRGDCRPGARLRRQEGAGDPHRRADPRRVPAGQGDGARLRPRARDRAGQGRRRLPDARNVRVGADASAARRSGCSARPTRRSPR